MGSRRVLLTAGSNAKGQLGIGSCNDAHTFTPCQFAKCELNQRPDPTSTVTQIACGANHTILLLEHLDGSTTLWGTGDGRKGQLGPEYWSEDSDLVPRTTFHELVLPYYSSRGYTFRYIAAAWESTYIVLSHPESPDMLLSMGSNDFGALGVGEGTHGGEPRVVGFGHIFSEGVAHIRSLYAGPRHVVVQLITAGRRTALVGWGASRHGQLGDHAGARCVARPTPLPIDIHDDLMVSCGLGNQHTVVLHASGRISALGSNKQGQIPSISRERRLCRLGCTWNCTYMQATDGDKHTLFATGSNVQVQLDQSRSSKTTTAENPIDLPDDRAISNLACGSEHVLVAMKASSLQDTSVLGWGWNEHGNMGLGYSKDITIPTQLWPRKVEAYDKYPQRVIGVWAGCATSWLLVE